MAIFSKKNTSNDTVAPDSFEVLPKHLGIIMDGNGRWAKKRALPRSAGHKAGAEVFRSISKECSRLGIEYVTFYAFSTENWKRPKEEVDAIMALFKSYLLDEAETDTASHTGTTVYLAINYGGRLEITQAVNKLIAEGKTKITEDDISKNIYTYPECDLIIRPSGEQRLSNFLLWQAAYSEFWYSDVLWPDFKNEDLYQALREFEKRNRRFGG